MTKTENKRNTEINERIKDITTSTGATEIPDNAKIKDEQKDVLSIGERFWRWLYYEKYSC